MKKTLVYDLPTRLFHVIFTLLFVIAFFIGKNFDDDNPIFAYHMLAGMTLTFVVLLRIVWGLVGSTYAKFSSFKLNPMELISYFQSMVTSKTKRYLSHNPASSFAAVFMMLLALGLGITGYLMVSTGNGDAYEDIHEIFANLFLLTVIGHIVGIIIHNVRHRDSIWKSMVDGKKDEVDGERGISHSYSFAGLIFMILTLGWVYLVNSNFDNTTGKLTLFGNELQLTEMEEEYNSSATKNSTKEKKDDDHDDDD